MRGLWQRIRQLVRWPWRGKERLRMAVDRLPTHPHYVHTDGAFLDSDADHVLRLLYGNAGSEASGPRPMGTTAAGTVGHTWTGVVQGEGHTSGCITYHWDIIA